MKKTSKILTIAVVLLLLCCTTVFVACDENSNKGSTPHTHMWGEWEIITPATCGAVGEEKRTCTCGDFETQSIPATGNHIYGEWKVITPATCGAVGEEKRTCTCGDFETQSIPATGNHIYSEWETVIPATCSVAGKEKRTCACGDFETQSIPATGNHIYGEWKVITPATCSKAGEEKHICMCGAFETQPIPATGIHVRGAWVVDKKATCTSSGYKSRYCKNCNIKIEETVIEATGHKTVVDAAVPASCNKTGLTEGSHCEFCGFVFTKQQEIARTHSYGNWVTSKKATSVETGTKYRTCSACGTRDTQTIPKITAVRISSKVTYSKYFYGTPNTDVKSIQYVVKESSTYSGKYDVTVTFQVFIHSSNGGSVVIRFADQRRKYYATSSSSGNICSYTFSNISAGSYTMEFQCFVGYVS